MPGPNWKTPSGIFLLTAALLLFFHGNLLIFTSDEGIILEPAQRMLVGARPYTDFFAYMSPGSYWLQSSVFRALGVSLWTGRLLVILDFSLQCALIYWLTARLASSKVAAAAMLAFAGFQIADPEFVTAQHRWDSATLALAGLCAAVLAIGGAKARWWAASGALIAAAAWCTPSMALVAAGVGLWLALSRERWKAVPPFVGGALAVSSLAVGALAISGSPAPFIHQMLWLRQNYSAVNAMPYGSVIGGYGNLLKDAAGPFELAVRVVLVACYALPAILPPAALILWGIALTRAKISAHERAPVQLLILAMIGLVLTTFPRADMMHLAFVAALPYALVGAILARFMPARAGAYLAGVAVALAILFAGNYFKGWAEAGRLSSPVGELRVATSQLPDVEKLLANVRPGESLFVYPYMPIHYFVTQARNPTRFCYLAPGMMTNREASETLAELETRPPRWLLYLRVSRDDFERVFPHGRSLDVRFENLEEWLERNYQPFENPSVNVSGYQLWRQRAIALPTVARN
jgi:4-amino-4-deoxy-L-arabinose transferase-like glycosyltransferase